MSIDTISDVLSRIGTIQQQMQQLQNGSLLDSALGSSGANGATGASGASGGSAASSNTATSATAFANQLAAAQDTSSATAAGTGSTTATAASSADASSLLSSLVSALGSGSSRTSLSSLTSGGTGLGMSSGVTSGASSGVSLPASASAELTAGQQQFASTLSAETGLNPSVVTAWLLAEESGGAAQSRQAAGNNDWLNIGYTDSATYGANDSVWADPTAAANATAEWLKGQNSIPGYGTASSGIQAILSTAGQTPEAQIQAIQDSGWSSGGYSSLPALYRQTAA